MWDVLVEEHPAASSQWGIARFKAGWVPGIDPAIRAFEMQRDELRSSAQRTARAQLENAVDEAHQEMETLQGQLRLIDLAVSRVARPVGVVGGLLVLAYVVASGVLVPLVLLALDVSLTRPAALGLLALFASGIGWLMAYLWVEVRRLAAPLRPVVTTETEEPATAR